MSTSWFLVAVRRSSNGRHGLWADAGALAETAQQVEILAAGDTIMELIAEDPAPERDNVRILIDGHSLRRRGMPPLPRKCVVVEPDFVARRLLDPDWKVVWR